MPKRNSFRSAFTLIEVMVAVMIVSVVIAALLQMRGNTSQQFFNIKKSIKTNQYNSFLLSVGKKYGFTNESMDMNRFVEDFDLESNLRRRLKSRKVKLEYEKLETIDTSEFDATSSDNTDNNATSGNSGIIFEIGKTTLKTDNFSDSLIRIRLQ